MKTGYPIQGALWTAVAGTVLAGVLLRGDWIRAAVEQHIRFAFCVTGATLFAVSTLAYIFFPVGPSRISTATWVKLLASGAGVGFVIFVLFVQDMECTLDSSGARIWTDCKDVRSWQDARLSPAQGRSRREGDFNRFISAV